MLRHLALLAFVTMMTPVAGHARGPRLPSGCTPLPDGQQLSPYPYQATINWLRKHNRSGKRGLKFVTLVDLPDVVAAHAESPSKSSGWLGINVSEYAGKTRIFVVK